MQKYKIPEHQQAQITFFVDSCKKSRIMGWQNLAYSEKMITFATIKENHQNN